jgi:hypothetical protein
VFLAALINIDVSVDISIISPFFCSPVIGVIQGATSVAVVANVAASVSLLNLINICLRLNALITVNPSFANILSANANSFASTLDNFFSAVGPASGVASSVLDVRSTPNFINALTAAGCPNIPALINLALLLNIAFILNQTFMQVLFVLVPALAAVLAQVLVLVENILIAVSALVADVLALVVGLLGGVLYTVAALLDGLVFPLLFSVVNVVFPALCGIFPPGLLNQLVPFSSSTFHVPSARLVPARNLIFLLNCAK